MQSNTDLSSVSDKKKNFSIDDMRKAIKELGRKYNYESTQCNIFEIFILHLAGMNYSLLKAITDGHEQTCIIVFDFKELPENDRAVILEKFTALNNRFPDLKLTTTAWFGDANLLISMNINVIMLQLLPLFEVFLVEQSKLEFEVSILKKYQEATPYVYDTSDFRYEIDTLLQERRESRVANRLSSTFDNLPSSINELIIRFMGAPAKKQTEGHYSRHYPDNIKPEEICEDSLTYQELIANAVYQELSKEEQAQFNVAEVAPKLSNYLSGVRNGRVTIAESLSLEVSEHIAKFLNRIKPKSTTAGQTFSLKENKATEEYTVDITLKTKRLNSLPKMYLLVGDQKIEVSPQVTASTALEKQAATLHFTPQPQDRYSIMSGGVPSVEANASVFFHPALRTKLLAIEAKKVDMAVEKPKSVKNK